MFDADDGLQSIPHLVVVPFAQAQELLHSSCKKSS